jgi:hypothetical protein
MGSIGVLCAFATTRSGDRRIRIIVATLTESIVPVAEFLIILIPMVVSLAVVGCMTTGGVQPLRPDETRHVPPPRIILACFLSTPTWLGTQCSVQER